MINSALMLWCSIGFLVLMGIATRSAMVGDWFGFAICSLVAVVSAVDWKIAALDYLKGKAPRDRSQST